MTEDAERTLGALFSQMIGGPGPTILSGDDSIVVREYKVTLRSGSDSSLASYSRLALAELATGQVSDWTGTTGGEGQQWAGFEFVQIDATSKDHPLDADHLYLVFSGPPEGVSPIEYDKFYAEHMRENLQMDSFSEGWRWRSSAIRLDPGGRALGPHLATYRMEHAWSEVLDDIASHTKVLSQSWPAWFNQINFTSLEVEAIGAAQGA